MSWETTSFLILGAVLFGGFAWYERSRPPSQVVALVAALAALAIAGRIAFAAFPNVKPTTDIVIFAGYALGPAPGFAVGALAALVSNFWFGQGPWTPWQMAGWGLCGVLGAALALGGRNVGRLGLAATCGLAGVFYGALLNFSLMATYGGDLSLQRFGVLEARAVPFDAAHALGNIAFALLVGPAMVRMLVRFRERFEWGRGSGHGVDRPPAPRKLGPGLRGGGIAALLIASLALGALSPARAHAEADGSTQAAALWLQLIQNSDGGWGASPAEDSSTEMTAWAMLGLEAAGRNPLNVARGDRNPVGFLRGGAGELKSPGDLARTILALEGAGVDPRHFGGRNLVSALLSRRRGNGSYEGWPGSTAFAVIALRAAGVSGGIDGSLSWLRKVQNEDGGWGDVPGSPSTADGTGAVMQALSAGSKAAHRGLSYLRTAQRPGGGFPLGGGGSVNTQSTAWAIQGILAAGGDPGSFRRGGQSAPDYLSAQQASDGHFRYSKSSDQTPVWVTGQVLAAAAGKYFPIAAPPQQQSTADATSQGSSTEQAAAGNVSPASPLAGPAAAPDSAPVSPAGSQSGGVGAPRERFATPGQATPEASAGTSPPGGRESGGSDTTAPQPLESSPSTDSAKASGSGGSGKAGAALAGALAGCLLFGAGWGGRRLWMRHRYGL